ncbi:MAG: hypothetical protein WAY93_08350, partial [Atopobiaceae bacterium]
MEKYTGMTLKDLGDGRWQARFSYKDGGQVEVEVAELPGAVRAGGEEGGRREEGRARGGGGPGGAATGDGVCTV